MNRRDQVIQDGHKQARQLAAAGREAEKALEAAGQPVVAIRDPNTGKVTTRVLEAKELAAIEAAAKVEATPVEAEPMTLAMVEEPAAPKTTTRRRKASIA